MLLQFLETAYVGTCGSTCDKPLGCLAAKSANSGHLMILTAAATG